MHVHLINSCVKSNHSLSKQSYGVNTSVKAKHIAVCYWWRGSHSRRCGRCGVIISGPHGSALGTLAPRKGALAPRKGTLGERANDGAVAVFQKPQRRVYAGVEGFLALPAPDLARTSEDAGARQPQLLFQPLQALGDHEFKAIERSSQWSQENAGLTLAKKLIRHLHGVERVQNRAHRLQNTLRGGGGIGCSPARGCCIGLINENWKRRKPAIYDAAYHFHRRHKGFSCEPRRRGISKSGGC
mmetsp:Transcript_16980/g.51365  ORF Transcript_16980/g.51365 Transcript_16980/m.51365 type:complete len:242 (-) Transcript_16980:885-1610(-)|eukprot:scaffold76036_cov31-Tisochrysis_lutea.AAC.3